MIKDKHRVSIVLPVFNGEKYLQISLDSIVNQTYQNWELIVVNDCSTDGSKEIIEKYCKKDSRIKLINNKVNQKLPKSLNIGFTYATGEYFTWTSDDNYYKPGAIKTMVEYLDINEDLDLVYASCIFVDKDNKQLFKWPSVLENQIWQTNVVAACFLYRKTLSEKVGQYDPDMLLVEDYDYWIRCHKKGKFLNIDDFLYYYRWHDCSLTSKYDYEINRQQSNLIFKHYDYLLSLCKTKNDIQEFKNNLYNIAKKNKDTKTKCKIKLKSNDILFVLKFYIKTIKKKIQKKDFINENKIY